LLVRALADRQNPTPQDDAQATYSQRIGREDAHIDWTQPAAAIWNQVRAYRGWPQAFTTFDGRQLKILRASPLRVRGAEPGTVTLEDGVPAVATRDAALRLDEVQLEGRRAMSGAAFARGYPRLNGTKLA
jgi:methionyl-tRNA formyltransferase